MIESKTLADAVLPGSKTSRKSRLLHLCNGLDPVRDGGMVPSILGMTGALSRLGRDVSILTPTPSCLGSTQVYHRVSLNGPEVDLKDGVRDAVVVHMHGLWQSHTRRGARLARALKVPYVIAAHGMAEPWALRQKQWKKRLYLALVEAKNLRYAACLHALSRPEISHLRQLAPWTPICFVPNGVQLDFSRDLPSRRILEEDYPELIGKFLLLFFGRVHTKKGLDLLAEALHKVCPDFPNLHLIVAGKDDGAWKPFSERIDLLGYSRRVTYLGHVGGDRARQVWGAADAFVLPSYSEGFSMAVLEALACSLPSLITTGCHFPELVDAQGAVVVNPTANEVAEGLRELLERTDDERRTLGQNGRRLVEGSYTWDQQARRLEAVYNWLTGGGPSPDCVIQ